MQKPYGLLQALHGAVGLARLRDGATGDPGGMRRLRP
jgi:hypothetical protein